ncbi:hypothetical protein, partial [Streptomyces sp. NPDC005141]
TLRSFLAHKGRLLLSALAIVLSVAFVAGSPCRPPERAAAGRPPAEVGAGGPGPGAVRGVGHGSSPPTRT